MNHRISKCVAMPALTAACMVLLTCSIPLSRAHAEDAVRVGFVVPLSGPLAAFGAAIRNGVALALEDDPRASAAIEPLYEDSMYDSTQAVAAFQKLNSMEHVRMSYV